MFLFILEIPAAWSFENKNVSGNNPGNVSTDSNDRQYKQFEYSLDSLRINLKIPALSAAIVKDKQVIWAGGFGLADIDYQIKATENTSYRVASLTKTYASTIIMQLVQEGEINLEAPVTEYGVNLSTRKVIKVKHLLNHTSQYAPGKFFRYSGARFGYLDRIIEHATGKSFGELFIERIILPLQLENTAPSVWQDTTKYPEVLENFQHAWGNLAKPYRLKNDYTLAESRYIMGFVTAGGLVTTLQDMAKYNIAMDTGFFFNDEIREEIYSPAISTSNKILPYGLGWFVQEINNLRMVWHYGWHPDAASSLILKVPELDIMFMVFANTDMLSKPFSLHHGDVSNSPAALIFMKHFLPEVYSEQELSEKGKVLSDIIFKSTGAEPVMSKIERVVFILFQLVFLVTIFFWPVRFIVSKIIPFRDAKNQIEGLRGFLIRSLAILVSLLSVFFAGSLSYYPPMVYWHKLPGWFDGIPLYQNLVLAIPTVITLLTLVLVFLTVLIWIRKIWTVSQRLHFSSVVLVMGLYLMLLNHWDLIGILYYWRLFIYNI